MKQIVLLFVVVCFFTAASAQNYFLGKSDDGIEECYVMSITTSKKTQSVIVFDRIKPVQGRLVDFRKKVLKNVVDKQTNSSDFEKELGYYRRKVQYNIEKKRYRIIEATYYGHGGDVLDKVEYKDNTTPWLPIPKGTLIEEEFNKVKGVK